jgi:hypothetical protein
MGVSRAIKASPLRIGLGVSCLASSHQSISVGSWLDGLVGIKGSKPAEDLVPSLAGEWEFQHQVVDGFTHLVTAWAARMMLQSMASKAQSSIVVGLAVNGRF